MTKAFPAHSGFSTRSRRSPPRRPRLLKRSRITALDLVLQRLRARRLDVLETADGGESQCPVHAPLGNLDLMISADDAGRVTLRCTKGCSRAEVLRTVDLTEADFSMGPRSIRMYFEDRSQELVLGLLHELMLEQAVEMRDVLPDLECLKNLLYQWRQYSLARGCVWDLDLSRLTPSKGGTQ